jgi:predicted RNase H-like nuclease (RuvC/YqgF family)
MAPTEGGYDCLLCDKVVKIPEFGLICSGKCQQYFHYDCLHISRNQVKQIKKESDKWKCFNCNLATLKTADMDPNTVINTKLDSILTRLNNLESLVGKVNDLEQRVEELEKSQKHLSDNYDDLVKQEGGVAQTKEVKKLTKDNETLKASLKEITWKLNKSEQEGLSDQFVLEGVPETEGEDVTQVVLLVCNSLKKNEDDDNLIDGEDLISVARMRPKIKRTVAANATTKPAPILVKVTRSDLATKVMTSKKENVPMYFPDLIGMAKTGKQIYINPMLTKDNKDLLVYARLKLKSKENTVYKFVWFKAGKVLARRTNEDKVVWIKDKEDVDKLLK